MQWWVGSCEFWCFFFSEMVKYVYLLRQGRWNLPELHEKKIVAIYCSSSTSK